MARSTSGNFSVCSGSRMMHQPHGLLSGVSICGLNSFGLLLLFVLIVFFNPLTGDRMKIWIFLSVTYIGNPIFMYVKARNAASPRDDHISHRIFRTEITIDRDGKKMPNCYDISVIYSEFLQVDSSGLRLELAN